MHTAFFLRRGAAAAAFSLSARLVAGLLIGTLVQLAVPTSGFAQTLPEVQLHFHGNTHEGTPPCTGNGTADVAGCGGPFLTPSASLDTAPAAHFDYNAADGTSGRTLYDGNWTWKPTAATTVNGSTVVVFWASCNATCVTFGGEWKASLWKNNVQVAPAPTPSTNDTDPVFTLAATPSTPDVPAKLSGSFVIASPINLNGSTDILTLKLEAVDYIDGAQGSRIYYDSQSSCPGDSSAGPCDSIAVFNARDTDGDGVPDVLDKCPGTPAGVTVDENGCPAQAACAATSASAAASSVPASGPTTVDAGVQSDWSNLGQNASYGAFVHFYRQGTRLQQDEVLRTLGLGVLHDFRRYTNSVFVQGPVWAFQRLVGHPWVMRIEHNAPLRYLDATQSWTTRVRMAQEIVAGGPYFDVNDNRLTGKGVTLGIMDSGLFGAHPDFAGRISHNFKYAAAGYVDVGYADSENGGGGHGTHVTGIVAGAGTQSDGGYPNADVAPFLPGTFTSASPEANIIHWGHGAGIFVLNIAAAYQHLLDNIETPAFKSLRAVNNSYGDGAGAQYNPNDANKQLIKRIVGCNVNMVFAAGNDGGDGSADNTSSYCKDPTPGVICVASYNDQGTGALNAPLSTFSSRGKKGNPSEYPDIAAPGDLSTSTCAQATPTQAICTGGDDQSAETEWQPWYGTISGTSMASPNITGVIGVIAQAEPDLTPAERELLLQRTARKVGSGYEDDPQHTGSTIHFGYGAGLVDIQKALDDLMAGGSAITKAGLRPQDEEWTIFDADSEPDVAEAAADAVKLTMQNFNLDGLTGVMYRLTLANATQFVSPALSYRVENNVRGVPARTTIIATPDSVVSAEPGPDNTAVATMVVREANVIRFFVPYSQMAYPAINEPIHNIRVVTGNDAGALDYAPAPANGTAQTAAVQPMFGRAFTTRLAPGVVPPSDEKACKLPGLTRVTSPGGTTGDSSNTGHDDLRQIWVAEPGDMPGKLVFTMKVENLNPAPIAGYRWYVYFRTPNRPEEQFVAMDTVAPGGTSAAPGFVHGYRETIDTPAAGVGNFTVEGDLDPASNFNANGIITLVLDKAAFGLDTGTIVTGIAGSIRQTSNPETGTGLTVDSAGALEGYTLVGNLICLVQGATAVLAADITSGPAPLTVNFDATDSSTTVPGASITSYTFDFGDGSDTVTQSAPTVSHTYTTAGDFTTTLTVTDSSGAISSNLAELDISAIYVNLEPIANAGTDFELEEGRSTLLNGSQSSDPDGWPEDLSYHWEQVVYPEDPVVTLGSDNTATPNFTTPYVTETTVLTFKLTVSDGQASTTDTVDVTVLDALAQPVPDTSPPPNTKILGGAMPSLSLFILIVLGLWRKHAPIRTGQSLILGLATRDVWKLVLTLLLPLYAQKALGATPSSGTLTETARTLTYTFPAEARANASPTIEGTDPAYVCDAVYPCDTYRLTVILPAGYMVGHPNDILLIEPATTTLQTDIDSQLEDEDGNVLTVTRDNPPTQPTIRYRPQDGTTVYLIQVVPGTPHEGGTVNVTLVAGDPPPPGGTPYAPRFQALASPATLGNSAGEPSIGYNPITKKAMFQAGLETLRVTFPEYRTDDPLNPDGLPEACDALWEDKTSPTTGTVTLDPIGLTDPTTGRNYAGQLGPKEHTMAYTDDDGETWSPSVGNFPGAAGVDHQTIGWGPYVEGGVAGPLTDYPNAVYYCSQDIAYANCSRSDDGGASFLPPVIAYNIAACGGLHGHVRAGPDGTVYLPNKNCNNVQAVAVSEDNGVNWQVRPIPDSSAGDTDPQMALASDGTGYFCYTDALGLPRVAVTKDKGKTWGASADLGTPVGVKRAVFAQGIAGDPGRAACGFIGTDTAGNSDAEDFPGIWYAYIATTYDGGKTWATTNVTPNNPVQGKGGICTGGTACGANRNLLDFNEMALDEKGRAMLGFADGCIGTCVGNPNTINRSDKAAIARIIGGKSLYKNFDQPEPLVPQAACLAGTRTADGSALSWRPPADDGKSPVTAYRIYRGTAQAAQSLLVTLSPKTKYTDFTTDSMEPDYFYKIVAVNALGDSVASNLIKLSVDVSTPPETPCTVPGLTIHQDAEGDALDGDPAHDVRKLSIAQPYLGDYKIFFTLKVKSLATVPQNTTWPVHFCSPAFAQCTNTNAAISATNKYYTVRMVSPGANNPGTAPIFQILKPQAAGTARTTVAADPSSIYKPDGTIVIVVKASDIGLTDGGAGVEKLGRFLTRVEVNAIVGSATPDNMPDSVSGAGEFATKALNFCAPNTPPQASLAVDTQSGPEPLTVQFDASGSQDTDTQDTVVEYIFDFGDGTENISQSTPVISHTYAEPGFFNSKLRVKDSRGLLSATAASKVIEVIDVNYPPIADAGTGFEVDEGDSPMLSGSAEDPDGDAISSYLWQQTAGPAVTLTNEDTPTPSFTAPARVTEDTDLTFKLTVTDAAGLENTNTAEVTITVKYVNLRPSARVGADFDIDEGKAVGLNDVDSTDPDPDPLTYSWKQLTGPEVELVNENEPMASFTAPPVNADTTLTFRLTVTDSGGLDASDDIEIAVHDVVPPEGSSRVAGGLSFLMLLLLGVSGLLRVFIAAAIPCRGRRLGALGVSRH